MLSGFFSQVFYLFSGGFLTGKSDVFLLLFLALVFFLSFILGRFLEAFKVPWIFSALLIGVFFSYFDFVKPLLVEGSSFLFLANLGMYFLLFIIGFELDLKEILSQGFFVLKVVLALVLSEALAGSLLIHYYFGVGWGLSLLVAVSFATVGEAVLLPILDKFKLTKTSLGQTILGVGVLDDFFEILTILIAAVLVGSAHNAHPLNISFNLVILVSLFVLVFVLVKFHKGLSHFKFKDIPSFFLFVIFFIFLFVGVGHLVDSDALGAILAGIALRNLVPEDKLKVVDSEIRTMSYGFFAPIFFLSVGLSVNLNILFDNFALVFFMMLVTGLAKVLSSYAVAHKVLGRRKSIVFGFGLTVKFSTSIVIIKFLLDNGLIGGRLYSVLVGTTIGFMLLVPFSLSYLILKWRIGSLK